MKNQIKVLIVDNNTLVRHGLVALINTTTDLIVVGEAEDSDSAAQKAEDLNPDVIVMDLMKPGLKGSEAIALFKQKSPQTRILILTNIGDEAQVLETLRSGVHGYLLKDAVFTNVVEAIRDVYTGIFLLHPSFTHLLFRAIREPAVH